VKSADAACRLGCAADRLEGSGGGNGQLEAELLAADLLAVSPGRLRALALTGNLKLPASFEAAISRRLAGEPLQYITGKAAFLGLDLAVGPGVFVPRPETELLAEEAINLAISRELDLVVDLGTGCGALAAALATACPDLRVVAVEVSTVALGYAELNTAGLAVELVEGDATCGQTLANLDGQVGLVVANPPYLPQGTPLEGAAAGYEPDLALWGGGERGLELPRAFLNTARRLLGPGGWALFELDPSQAGALRSWASSIGFEQVTTKPDLVGRTRILQAGLAELGVG